jgi:hypothetical protein
MHCPIAAVASNSGVSYVWWWACDVLLLDDKWPVCLSIQNRWKWSLMTITSPPCQVWTEAGWSLLFQVFWYITPCILVYSCWHLGKAVPQSSASSDPIRVTISFNKTYAYPSTNLWCNISESGILGEVTAAVDINNLANKVYQHNFPITKLLQRNIQSLSAKEINDYCIDTILMSPPCQPFTRWESALFWKHWLKTI